MERWVEPLIEKLSPTEPRHLARLEAHDLRISQLERIKALQNPDGNTSLPASNRP
ncbi:phage virion morphogenesis protein [Halomonas salipaludis]|uniref:hypothetical protein n=1 Tax=Halomonas salipaludis TaxID=2032625 RepID=UPI0038994438